MGTHAMVEMEGFGGTQRKLASPFNRKESWIAHSGQSGRPCRRWPRPGTSALPVARTSPRPSLPNASVHSFHGVIEEILTLAGKFDGMEAR